MLSWLFAVTEHPGLVRKLHLPWSNWFPFMTGLVGYYLF